MAFATSIANMMGIKLVLLILATGIGSACQSFACQDDNECNLGQYCSSLDQYVVKGIQTKADKEHPLPFSSRRCLEKIPDGSQCVTGCDYHCVSGFCRERFPKWLIVLFLPLAIGKNYESLNKSDQML